MGKSFSLNCMKYAQNLRDEEFQRKSSNRERIKVLFLDVDGVLNTQFTSWNERDKGIEDILLKYLKVIVQTTKCKIVLSSAWRLHKDYTNILFGELEKRGNINIADTVIGKTPYIRQSKRTTEILSFIHDYNLNADNKWYIYNFCVIDDLPLNKYTNSSLFEEHFVRTNKVIGISIFNVMECVEILNKKSKIMEL